MDSFKLRQVYVGWFKDGIRIRVGTGDIVVTPKHALQIAYRIIKRVWERQP